MKNLLKKSLLTTASLLVVGASANYAHAQTANVTATAIVQNQLTLAVAQQMNFGTVVAVGDAAQTASVTLDTAGAITHSTTGGTAVTATVDDTAATQAQITVADGADGATINVVIQNVTNPTDGTDTFTLENFVTSYNGGADNARTPATPFTVVFDAAVGPNLNTLDIGADITTAVGAGAYGDATYNGGFDVVFSY